MKHAKVIRGGVTAPQGYSASGLACGIKKSGKPDLALIVSDRPAQAAGCFTTNRIRASCVIFSEKQLKKGQAQAIVANSGNANTCTGKRGTQDTLTMANTTAKALGIQASRVLVSSTGTIGHSLPMDKIKSGIVKLAKQLKKTPLGSQEAGEAILTTDLRVKEIAMEIQLAPGKACRIGVIAKGSGMIHPNMATMLCYITTDAAVPANTLNKMLQRVTAQTFNMISVDGDTSTNDSVILLANGASGHTLSSQQARGRFEAALFFLCKHLAKEIVKDGEGVTKLFEVQVRGATSPAAARAIARTLTTSPLVKTAIYGSDPNWGRLMGAIGRAGFPVQEEKIDIAFDNIPLAKQGKTANFHYQKVKQAMGKDELTIQVHLHQGKATATAWGCDLTHGYVTINAKYHT